MNRKPTLSELKRIRRFLAKRRKITEIARELGVNRVTLHHLLSGRMRSARLLAAVKQKASRLARKEGCHGG